MRFRAALFLLLASWAQAGEVYKSVDAQGHVVYSDQPSPNAQKVAIATGSRDNDNAQRIAREQKLYQVEEAQRQKLKAEEDKKQQQDEARHAELCERVRNSYFQMKDARRLYNLDEHGNRTYYSDKEADAQRAAAQLLMQTECAS